MKHNHMFLMVVGCIATFIIIFGLSFFGVTKKLFTGIAIAFMVVIHVWMMKGHGHNHSDKKEGGVT